MLPRASVLLRALLLCVAVASPVRAWAAGVVILTDPKVPQYTEAVAAARTNLPGDAVEMDPGSAATADALRAQAPDLVVAVGQKAMDLAVNTLPGTPVVYCMVLERNARTGKNVTGVPLDVSALDQLRSFRQVNPRALRYGLLYDANTAGAFLADATKAAATLGVTLVSRPVADAKEVRAAAAAIAGSIDVLWLPPDPRLFTKEVFDYLLVFTLERKIALVGFVESFAQAGALASVSTDYKEVGKRAGVLAKEILAKPADKRMPLPPPSHAPGLLSINLRTAERLGLTVPAPVANGARSLFR